jgi:hypothetical protein
VAVVAVDAVEAVVLERRKRHTGRKREKERESRRDGIYTPVLDDGVETTMLRPFCWFALSWLVGHRCGRSRLYNGGLPRRVPRYRAALSCLRCGCAKRADEK